MAKPRKDVYLEDDVIGGQKITGQQKDAPLNPGNPNLTGANRFGEQFADLPDNGTLPATPYQAAVTAASQPRGGLDIQKGHGWLSLDEWDDLRDQAVGATGGVTTRADVPGQHAGTMFVPGGNTDPAGAVTGGVTETPGAAAQSGAAANTPAGWGVLGGISGGVSGGVSGQAGQNPAIPWDFGAMVSGGVTGGTTPASAAAYYQAGLNGSEFNGPTGAYRQGAMQPATPYQAALWSYGEAPQYRSGEWDQRMRDALDRAGRGKFEYDLESDPVWQAYKAQYTREGQRAMEDTLGRVSARTGGLASSYGATAAAQQRNYYGQQLTDKIPELYQAAYERYLAEYQRQLGLADTYRGLEDRDYERWNNGVLGQYNRDRELSYQQWRDTTGDRRTEEQEAYERALQADRDAYNRGVYANETEYSRALDAYERQRQAEQTEYDRRRYQEETDYNRGWNEYDRRYGESQDEYERRLALAKLGAQYGDYGGLTALGISPQEQTVYARAVGGSGGSAGSGSGNGSGSSSGSSSGSPVDSLRTRPDYLNLVNDAVQGAEDRDVAITQLAGLGVTPEEILASRQLEPGVGSTAQGGYSFRGNDISGVQHQDGRTMSEGYRNIRQVLRNDPSKGLTLLNSAVKQGLIHEYEVDMLMDEFGLD